MMTALLLGEMEDNREAIKEGFDIDINGTNPRSQIIIIEETTSLVHFRVQIFRCQYQHCMKSWLSLVEETH